MTLKVEQEECSLSLVFGNSKSDIPKQIVLNKDAWLVGFFKDNCPCLSFSLCEMKMVCLCNEEEYCVACV